MLLFAQGRAARGQRNPGSALREPTASMTRGAARRAHSGTITEPLEQRTMLSAQWPGAVVGVTPGSTPAGAVPALHLVDAEAGGTMVRDLSPVYPIHHTAAFTG